MGTEDRYIPIYISDGNTPIKGLNKSPAQITLNRRIRTSLPILSKLLEPEIPDNIKKKKEEVQRKTSYYYNKSAIVLRLLEIG